MLGPQICRQLGPEALDSAVTQTAGLLPRDLQALAADAAAAAAARGLDTSPLLPKLGPLQAVGATKLQQQGSDHDGEVECPLGHGGLWRGAKGQEPGADGQHGDDEGQQASFSGRELVQVSGADVQASLDRVRLRTATVIGAPKVSPPPTPRFPRLPFWPIMGFD